MSALKQIKDIKVNSIVTFAAVVSEMEIRSAKNGNEFISMSLMDKSGIIKGICWNTTDTIKNNATVGSIVQIMGRSKEFNGVLQLDITEVFKHPEQDYTPYINGEVVDVQAACDVIDNAIDQLSDRNIKDAVHSIYNQYRDQMMLAPAAKFIHHGYPNGLIQHTSQMVSIAQHLLTNEYKHLNRDIVIGALILHDLGKIFELTDFPYDYTLAGQFFGHIAIVDALLVKHMTESNLNLNFNIGVEASAILLMRHTILSHHGKTEWGSPITPKIPEAVFVHKLDQLDATLQVTRGALNQTTADNLKSASKVYSLDNTHLFNTDTLINGIDHHE